MHGIGLEIALKHMIGPTDIDILDVRCCISVVCNYF